MSLDLDQLEKLGKAATQGPWACEGRAIVDQYFPVSEPLALDCEANDAAFIVAARNNWQAMIDELREHRGFRDLLAGRA